MFRVGTETREKFVKTPNGDDVVRGMEWDVSHSMRRCVVKYEAVVHNITGVYPRIVHADTPFIPSETKHARCRPPTVMKLIMSVRLVAIPFQ